jgi:ubiquinone/menaquinone biosynthesis C-methylase UbiE
VPSLITHLFPRSAQPAHTRGHTLGAPRFYELTATFLFLGRRRASFQALIGAAGVAPGQRVLDVGCGTGYFARLLGDAVGPQGLVVGVDASPEMVGYARRAAGQAGPCRFEVGTVEALAFPAEHFDVVATSLMLHHLPADLQPVAVREMARVLRPGGTLLIADATQPPPDAGWQLFAALTGHLHMARMVPDLEVLTTQAGLIDLHSREVPPWLRYVRALKPRS